MTNTHISSRSNMKLLCLGFVPLALASSLGPLLKPSTKIDLLGRRVHPSSSWSLTNELQLLGSDGDEASKNDVQNLCLDEIISQCRGGADFIDDDDDSWGDDDSSGDSQMQQFPGQGQQSQNQNPYGDPSAKPPWQQQQQQQQGYQQHQGGGGGGWDQTDMGQGDAADRGDEPALPGEPQYPPQNNNMYNNNNNNNNNRGPPRQQHQGQNPYSQHMQQQQRGPPQQYPPQHQQQQQQQRGQYPPPPNFPGYGADPRAGSDPRRQKNQNQHPSQRIHNAHNMQGMPQQQQQQQPPGMNYDEEDESDNEEGGVELPTKSGDGVDLSQFNKDVIFNGLKRLYRKKIRPLELSSKYGHFHSPPLSPSDFDSKPMVLLLGQYSVGKTSFIRYLLGRDFPGQRIGPEPTTDRFVAIIKGESGDKIVPGAALCSQADRPFGGLSSMGNNFLSRFEGVEMDSPILNNITLVDTPGILSGQKQSIGRNYDYEQVMKWFAERADLIIIMFDAHKLDISDELKRVIELLKPHQDKMRVLLNKADAIETQQLMRVYGALMWSLGKVMLTPEVCRVYMGSFWGAPLKNKEQSALLMQEKQDLFNDIAQLPQNAVMRRINELVKRARSVKVHAYIIHYLRKQLPYTWGKREKQRRLIDRLDREFVMCARRYELPRGDFPELEPFRQACLEIKDLSEIHKLDKKMVKEMDKVFSVDIPNLLEAAKDH